MPLQLIFRRPQPTYYANMGRTTTKFIRNLSHVIMQIILGKYKLRNVTQVVSIYYIT